MVAAVKAKSIVLTKQSGNVFLDNTLPSHFYLAVNDIDIFVEIPRALILHTSGPKDTQSTGCNLPLLRIVVHGAHNVGLMEASPEASAIPSTYTPPQPQECLYFRIILCM